MVYLLYFSPHFSKSVLSLCSYRGNSICMYILLGGSMVYFPKQFLPASSSNPKMGHKVCISVCVFLRVYAVVSLCRDALYSNSF